VVAVSVDSVEDNRRVVEKLGLGFPILSDGAGKMIAAYGVTHEGGGMGGGNIARPAAILVDADGTVVWRNLTENWRVRTRPEHVLEAIHREIQ